MPVINQGVKQVLEVRRLGSIVKNEVLFWFCSKWYPWPSKEP